MPPLTLEDTLKLARLARLELHPAETTVQDLGAIVDYFDQLADFEADETTDDPSKTLTTSGEAEDRPGKTPEHSVFAEVFAEGFAGEGSIFKENAPHCRDGFLVVPKVKADL